MLTELESLIQDENTLKALAVNSDLALPDNDRSIVLDPAFWRDAKCLARY